MQIYYFDSLYKFRFIKNTIEGGKNEKVRKLLLCLIAGFFLLSGFTSAQEQAGQLVGTVTDDQGNPLPGVLVEARGESLIGTATANTDDRGRYRLFQLPPGEYTITFTLDGFTRIIREEVGIILGRTLSLDITMTPATLEEEMTVVGQAPVLDVTKSATTYEISKEMFNKLPKGRNFNTVVTIASGVNDEDAQLSGLSFDGASSCENMYFLDGMNTTSIRQGLSGQDVVFEHVEEVQVKSSGYEAQFGGSMGGVINIITRTGGNEYHGEGVFYLESSALTGEERPSLRIDPYNPTEAGYITWPKDDWGVYELGLSLGGYLVKDRLWFFASYVPKFQITDRIVTFIQEPTVLPSKTNQYTQSRRWDRASLKLTFQAMPSLRMNLSYMLENYRWRGDLPDRDGTQDINYDYAKEGLNYPSWTGTFSADYTASNNWLISVKAGRYWTDDGVSIMEPPDYPRYYFEYSNIDIPGVPEGMIHPAGWYSYPFQYWNKEQIKFRTSASIDTTYFFDFSGAHVIKAGFTWARASRRIWNMLNADYDYFYWGRDYFSPNFGRVETEYGYFRVREPSGDRGEPDSDSLTFYIQDSWTLFDRLTLNFGIRAEKENYPSYLDPESDLAKQHPEYLEDAFVFDFSDKIAPRLGFSYDIFGNSRLKVFGSYGIYYDVMKLHMSAAVGGSLLQYNYYHIPEYLVYDYRLPEYEHGMNNPPSDLAPYYIESINHYIPSFDKIQPDIKPYSKMEYTFGVQGKISQDISFSARYLHNQIMNAIEDIGIMMPEGNNYYIANPGSDYINEKYAQSVNIPEGVDCPPAIRRYDSMDLGIDKKFSDQWMAGLHYTLSRLWGNMSGLASSDEHGRQDPNTSRYYDAWHLAYTQNYPEENTGLLNSDRTHQIKFYGAYTFDFGLTVGTNVYAMSGTPESTEFLIQWKSGFYPIGRADMGRTPSLWKADFYAEYNIKITDDYSIQLNTNITNLTNNRIAQRIYNRYNLEGFWMDEEALVAGFDYRQVARQEDLILDPRYGKQFYFQSPIAIRLGLKFIF